MNALALEPGERTQIRAWHAIDGRRSLLRAAAFVAIWLGCAAVALAVPLLALRLACYCIAGACAQGLVILMHDGVHHVLFRNRVANRWVAFVCGLPAFLSVTSYRVGHFPHHRHERGARDPDEIENFSTEPRVHAALLVALLLAGDVFGLWRVGPWNVVRARGAERRAVALEYALIVAAFAAAVILLPGVWLLHGWLLPSLFARQLTNVRTLAEHALTGHSRLTATRSVPSNRFVSFFMCNLNYHHVHHLYPGVPWYHLPALHAMLAGRLERSGAQIYRSYTAFLLDFARFVARAWGPGGRDQALTLRPAA